MEYTRKELLAVPKRNWNEALHGVSGVYVIPSGRKHDSGWACMDFVAEFKDLDKPPVRFGGCCDDWIVLGRAGLYISGIPDIPFLSLPTCPV